ncbi:transcriptional regulator [Umezawaea sp. Da 62-37]|uniref:transcriptional regulator n=1 Tax=Umezawaea sp. Da 62-37 TaxID=3075927 RepID=UPI0028F714FD|nr:transcriptional regulator [Umezawaea sp. Da 62-37]WNV91191.1 transcriptional regulator [Umezawaea sp. Da 62-37]
MFVADGGGGSSQPPIPEYSGSKQGLRVDPSAIPAARKVFEDALSELDTQLTDTASALKAKQWAMDPVSRETAEKFNHDTFASGDSAALTAILAYREQLNGVVTQLTQIEATYRRVEGDNVASWGRINPA